MSCAENVEVTTLLPGTAAAPADTAVDATSRAWGAAVPDTMIVVSPAIASEAPSKIARPAMDALTARKGM